jgi:hypothetical protein
MTLMLLSIVLVWTAPLLYNLAERQPTLRRSLERIIAIAVGVVVLFSILPESYYVVGPWALAIAALGMLLPSLVERVWHSLAHKIHWIPLVLGVVGLALHAAMDGASLIDMESDGDVQALPFAVLIHRAFEGVFVWFAVRPRFGVKWGAIALALVSLFTVLGYVASDHYFHAFHTTISFHYFQALVAGSLLHLAIDRHDTHRHHHHA